MPQSSPGKTLNTPASLGQFVAFRLKPGQDLIDGLRQVQRDCASQAMAIVTCVGSLTRVHIRHANCPEATLYQGHYEITSLTGTIDPRAEHLHLTITDGQGRAFGGHLLPDSAIYTTAEIVCLLLPQLAFSRELCPASGYEELVITPATSHDEGNRA